MLLKDILAPISETIFMYRGVKSYKLVHVTGRNSDIYKDVVNDTIIDQYLRKTKSKKRVDLTIGERYIFKEMVGGWIDGDPVEIKTIKAYKQHIENGHAAIIKDIGRFGDEGRELHELIKDIDRLFNSNFSLWCNVYASNKNRALPPHTDGDSIIVLQYEGSREWDFFGLVTDWRTNKPVEKITINQGDFLYFPKWAPHVAAEVTHKTGHMTFQIPTHLDRNATCPEGWECVPSAKD